MTEVFSDIPLWMLMLWAGFVILITLFYYRKKSWVADIATWLRFFLIGLRGTGLFLLGLLLFGILIKGTSKEVNLPLVLTLVDDSESMLNYKDSSEVEAQTKSFLNELESQLGYKFNSLTFDLSKELNGIDYLSFNYKKTDLSQPLSSLYDNYYGRNIGAVILISDGNFNSGTTPLIVAEKFKRTPFYTISVGDTIQKVDHLVKTVINNDIAFLNNKFPVEVSIEGNLVANKSFDVQLLKDGKVLLTKQLKHQDNEYSLVTTDFLLDANAIGIHEYTVKITDLDKEYNFDNNEKSFFVEVLDDRSKLLFVVETLNPDVGAIKSALVSENNLEVEITSIEDLPSDFTKYDLLVWFDPGVKSSATQLESILKVNKPIWYFISPQTSKETIAKLQLQATMSLTGKMDNIGAAFNSAFNLFKLSAETRKAMDYFPPLKVHYGQLKFNNSSSILAFQKVGNIAKTDPLFYFWEQQKIKYAVTFGTGVWNWKLANYQMSKTSENFNEIVRKTVQYLILKENTSRLRINMPTINNSEEDFIVHASFYNESYEPITEPTIQFKLKNQKEETFDFSFLPLDNEYHLNLGKLMAGKYSWVASTSFNGKEFSKSGSFAIKDLALEKQSTKANHQLMAQIADNSDGKFALLVDYADIIKDLREREDIVPIAYESSMYRNLVDYIWLLLLIIGLFTTEWLIRRYSGAY